MANKCSASALLLNVCGVLTRGPNSASNAENLFFTPAVFTFLCITYEFKAPGRTGGHRVTQFQTVFSSQRIRSEKSAENERDVDALEDLFGTVFTVHSE